MTRALTILFLLTLTARAGLIPETSSWTCVPSQTVGVIGGIPDRTTVTNVSGLNTNGGADCAAAINAVISGAPSNSVIQLPAGTLAVSNYVSLRSYKTLRGVSGQTVIKQYGEFANIRGENGGANLSGEVSILSGYTVGSSNLLLSSALNVATYTGGAATIYQSNAPDVFMTGGYQDRQQQRVTIVSVSGSNAVIWPPLCWTMSNSLAPRLNADCYWNHVDYAGLESVVLDAAGITGGGSPIGMGYVKNSWFKDVVISNYLSYGVQLSEAINCEVRSNSVLNASSSGNNHAGVIVWTGSGNLIEDCAIVNAMPPVEFMGPCSANAVLYNLLDDSHDGSTMGAGASPTHSNHNHHNLWEGNKCQKIQFDQNDGSGSDDILLRNWLTGTNHYATEHLACLDVMRYYRRLTAVGNILGAPGKTFVFRTPEGGSASSTAYYCWSFGYTAIGYWEGSGYDTNVESTTTLWQNYDYATAGVPVAQQTAEMVPTSLAYAATPAWWPAGKPWPPYAYAATTNTIPAEDRYLGITSTGGGGGTTNTSTGTLRGNGVLKGSGRLL